MTESYIDALKIGLQKIFDVYGSSGRAIAINTGINEIEGRQFLTLGTNSSGKLAAEVEGALHHAKLEKTTRSGSVLTVTVPNEMESVVQMGKAHHHALIEKASELYNAGGRSAESLNKAKVLIRNNLPRRDHNDVIRDFKSVNEITGKKDGRGK